VGFVVGGFVVGGCAEGCSRKDVSGRRSDFWYLDFIVIQEQVVLSYSAVKLLTCVLV
jgi:hypothetical protein